MHKIRDRGFWISHHFYWQSLGHYLYYSALNRSFTFFSAVNPVLDFGGMLDDRKTDVYNLLAPGLVPRTTIMTSKSAAEAFFNTEEVEYPVIIKPNVGFQGFKVMYIADEEAMDQFFAEEDVHEREWLLQEYVAYDREYAVLVVKDPNTQEIDVTSFIEKRYPFVIADGELTLRALIEATKNPFLDKKVILKRFADRLEEVPPQGERIVINTIGNYSKGAKFYDMMSEVSEPLRQVMKEAFGHIQGLNFFRVDLKADSVADLCKGHFKVMEINGAKSEPLHIYAAGSSFYRNYQTIRSHWAQLGAIAKIQRANQVDVPSLREGLKSLLATKKLVK